MKKLLILILLATGLQAHAQQYVNPVYPRDWADPTVWQAADGLFYSISTGQNHRRPLLCSPDLVHWQPSHIVPIDQPTMRRLRQVGRMVWAPDVAMVNGRRMLYLTLYNRKEDASIVALRESRTPGQFEYAGIITRGRDTGIDDTIDPEVIVDPTTGRVWLFFGSMGRIHRVELNEWGSQLAQGATYTHVAGLHGSEDGPERNCVMEGAYLHYRRGWWYLFVSTGQYQNHTYQVKVGRSRTLDGTFTDRQGRPMTQGFATPVIQSEPGSRFFGPGHNGEIFTDNKGYDFILYHCHDSLAEQTYHRPMLLQRITWDGKGWPRVKNGVPALQAKGPKFGKKNSEKSDKK